MFDDQECGHLSLVASLKGFDIGGIHKWCHW